MPTDLASLRQQISEKFMFSPSDAAEIIVSYAKDLGKKIIQTEQDFVTFISDKINKVDLDISQDSKLFQQNLKTLEKESQDNKKLLEEALKKKEDIKKRKETVLKDRKEYPHKLIDAVHHYGIEEVNFHRAIEDTKALFEVTKALKRERNDLVEYVNIFGYNPKYGVGGLTFPFIEYKPQYYSKFMKSSDDILPRK